MSHNPRDPAPLDYKRPSPVRGQLEAHDPKAPEGWRYIQTTDTPGELKVLLPPATATMYEQLLKLEAYELTKKSSINWERIMEIRHLKDRMIRKCQRLAKPAQTTTRRTSRGDSFTFQTVVAPSDFRLKEMEKWFRDQRKRLPTVATGTQKPSTSRQIAPPTAPSHTQSGRHAPNPALVLRSITYAAPPSKEKPPQHPKPVPQHVHVSRAERTERSVSLLAKPLANSVSATPAVPETPLSPLPLPTLLLSQREQYGLDVPPDFPSERPAPLLPGDPIVDPSDGSCSIPSPGNSNVQPPSRPLRRTRSCIKRSSSMGELPKSVSWADGQALNKQLQGMSNLGLTSQLSGTWSEVRSLYVDQIKGLESLHEQVRDGLDHLRTESDQLQRLDDTIRRQRETLEQNFKEFETNYNKFQEKVQVALAEATESLNRTNITAGPSPLPPIHEN